MFWPSLWSFEFDIPGRWVSKSRLYTNTLILTIKVSEYGGIWERNSERNIITGRTKI